MTIPHRIGKKRQAADLEYVQTLIAAAGEVTKKRDRLTSLELLMQTARRQKSLGRTVFDWLQNGDLMKIGSADVQRRVVSAMAECGCEDLIPPQEAIRALDRIRPRNRESGVQRAIVGAMIRIGEMNEEAGGRAIYRLEAMVARDDLPEAWPQALKGIGQLGLGHPNLLPVALSAMLLLESKARREKREDMQRETASLIPDLTAPDRILDAMKLGKEDGRTRMWQAFRQVAADSERPEDQRNYARYASELVRNYGRMVDGFESWPETDRGWAP